MNSELATARPCSTIGVAGRTDTLLSAICAALLGSFLIWGVGFAHISAFHNAAHDTRHSAAFPCH
jgi:cobalt transporter subunit CbtB